MLRQLVVELIGKEDWSSMSADVKGDAYEGLLEHAVPAFRGCAVKGRRCRGPEGATTKRSARCKTDPGGPCVTPAITIAEVAHAVPASIRSSPRHTCISAAL